MVVINWILIALGNAAAWLCGALSAFFGAAGGFLDSMLNPVFSRVLGFLNPICTVVGDAVYSGLSILPAWLGLTLVSAAVGVLLLICFRYTSNQVAIGRARDDITANLLAMKLFKDEMSVGLRSQGRLLAALGRLQWHMLRPLLILLLPMLLILAQMGVRYQWRPLRPGERSLIKLRLNPQCSNIDDAELQLGPGLVIEAGPAPGNGELVWRIRAAAPGRHTLRVNVGGACLEKELVVGQPFERVSAERVGYDWTSQIFHPVEPLLPADSPVRSIAVLYGTVNSRIYGANWWVLYFFIVSTAFALLFKRALKVRF
jgi:hypothetical protein